MFSKPKVAIAINNNLCFSLQKLEQEWRRQEEEAAVTIRESSTGMYLVAAEDCNRKLLQFQKKRQLEEQGAGSLKKG